MSLDAALSIFICSLLVAGCASALLARGLDRLGAGLGFSAALLGLVTAMAADSPEIAAAVTAIGSGKHDLGAGVIFGSNVFNLAALLGLCAVTMGTLRCRREQLILHASANLCVTAICAAQIIFHLSPLFAGLALAIVVIPYVAICGLNPDRLRSLGVPPRVRSWIGTAVSADDPTEPGVLTTPAAVSWLGVTAIPVLLGLVVAGSIGMVRAATVIGARFELSEVVMGTLVLATLTGIPNLIAALRLATQNRGPAIVSETFNSNTLNLIAGAYLPTLFVATPGLSPAALHSLMWLAAFTIIAAELMLWRRGLTRACGILLIAVYLAYVTYVLLS